MKKSKHTPKDTTLSRRDFIKVAGVFAGSAVLAACTPQGTSPTTPPPSTPTQIPEPSPASEPQFATEVQAKFVGTDFTLNANGEIEVKDTEAENGKTVVKGIKVNQDGSAVVSYQGENKDHQNKTYKIKGEAFIKNLTAKDGIITFTDEDGVLWTYDHAKSRVLFPELTREMNLPDEFPDIDLGWALTAPEFDQRIFDLQEKGRFVELTGEEIPIEPGDLDFHEYSGGGNMLAFTINYDKFDSKGQVPVQIVAIYKFDYNGFQGHLLIERWTDKSGNPKFRKVVAPNKSKFEETPKELLAQSVDLGYGDPDRFPVGRIIQNDLGLDRFANDYDIKNPESFKDFYKKYQDLFERYHNIYKSLNETGELDNTNGIPIVIAHGFKTNVTGK